MAAAGTGWAAEQDRIERKMAFVEKCVEATELMGSRQFEQALAIFEALNRDYSDLDADGFAAISAGDCLLALERREEARRAYQLAASLHPELRERVEQRIIDLELTQDVDDGLIERLRRRAAAGGEGQQLAQWDLARALQRRALPLLEEADSAVRAAMGETSLGRQMGEMHLSMLKHVSDSLTSLVDQIEGFHRMRQFDKPASDKPLPPALTIEDLEWRMKAGVKDAAPVAFEIRRTESCEIEATGDGKTIELAPDQQFMLRHYQEAIGRILVEAAGKADGNAQR